MATNNAKHTHWRPRIHWPLRRRVAKRQGIVGQGLDSKAEELILKGMAYEDAGYPWPPKRIANAV